MSPGTKRTSQVPADAVEAKKLNVEHVTIEQFHDVENKESRRIDHTVYENQFTKEAEKLKKYLVSIAQKESEKILPSSSLLNVAKMRRTSRLANYAISLIKKENTAALEQVEATYLQLQNAKSEIQHLRKEVERCLQFRSGDESIELVPEEEFYESAPASISKPEVTKDDEHEKRLAQLNWELQQRKELVGTLTEQEARKSLLISDINGKEQRLKSLKPKIGALIKSAKPVQEVLGVRYTFARSTGQRDLFPLLPRELCVLYVQAEAYKEIMDDDTVNVVICGTSEEADKWNREQSEADEDSEDEKDDKVESDDRRTRTVSSCLEKQKSRILSPHPISICIKIGCRDDIMVYLHLKFVPCLASTFLQFEVQGDLPQHGNVCYSDSLFDDLYAADDGSEIPDPIGEAKLSHLNDLGRPYKFVQQLTGRGSSSLQKEGLQLADALQHTVKLVKSRVSRRVALTKLLCSLEQQTLFNSIAADIPKKIVTEMTEFKNISYEDYEVAVQGNRSEIPNLSSGFFYMASLQHAPTSLKVIAYVHIPTTYPNTAPLFSLISTSKSGISGASTCNPSDLKDLERFVNVLCLTSFAKSQLSSDSLLLYQISWLASRIDVLSDTTMAADKDHEHLYARLARGRDDELPLKYDGHLFSFA